MALLCYSLALTIAAVVGDAEPAAPTVQAAPTQPAVGTEAVRLGTQPDNVLAAFATPRKQLRAAALEALDAKAQADVQAVAQQLKDGQTDAAMARWEQLITALVAGDPTYDVNPLIQWVLRAAYIEPSEELVPWAHKLSRLNGQVEQVQDCVSRLRKQQAEWQEAPKRNGVRPGRVTVSAPAFVEQADGSGKLTYETRTLGTDAGWHNCLEAMARELDEVSMSFNLQYLQLQHTMEARSRQLTLVSGIMRAKHDTAKNAINNIR